MLNTSSEADHAIIAHVFDYVFQWRGMASFALSIDVMGKVHVGRNSTDAAHCA